MIIDKKYKWLFPYTMACGGGNLAIFQKIVESEKFQNFFKGDFSRQKVRDYFMGQHNEETLNGAGHSELSPFRFFHLVIPYGIKEIGEEIRGEIFTPFYDNLTEPLLKINLKNKSLGIVKTLGLLERELRTGEILLSHAYFIADVCEKKDLARYSHLYKKVAAA